MAIERDPLLHTFPDRAMRQLLRYPANLRALLSQVVPDLVSGFAVDQLREVQPVFQLDDWRKRETDLLVEVPYQSRNGQDVVFRIMVLIEHQTQTDPLMPIRTLIAASQYWDREWKDSEEPETEQLRLTPVLPIVFHTGARVWGSARELADLMDIPDELREVLNFRGAPHFWSIAERTVEDLLDSEEPWLQMLAVIRPEDAEATEFRTVLQEALHSIEGLHDTDLTRWYDLLRVVLTWAVWRRPGEEQNDLLETAVNIHTSANFQREVREMSNTIAESWLEQGKAIGREEGIEQGRVGKVREILFQLGQAHLGEPTDEIRQRITEISDESVLDGLLLRISQAESWGDLLLPEKNE